MVNGYIFRESNSSTFILPPSFIRSTLDPIALRMVKTPLSFGRSECNRVKKKEFASEEEKLFPGKGDPV